MLVIPDRPACQAISIAGEWISGLRANARPGMTVDAGVLKRHRALGKPGSGDSRPDACAGVAAGDLEKGQGGAM
jgi:hypothetical protein